MASVSSSMPALPNPSSVMEIASSEGARYSKEGGSGRNPSRRSRFSIKTALVAELYKGLDEKDLDVIVTDGYSGNIFLKTMEGTGGFLAKELKAMFKKSLVTKLGALCVKDGIAHFKKLLDSGEVGGTALVGISKPVIKAHGSSDDYAIKNAIRQAASFAASGIIEDITENIDHMRLERTGAAAE